MNLRHFKSSKYNNAAFILSVIGKFTFSVVLLSSQTALAWIYVVRIYLCLIKQLGTALLGAGPLFSCIAFRLLTSDEIFC